MLLIYTNGCWPEELSQNRSIHFLTGKCHASHWEHTSTDIEFQMKSTFPHFWTHTHIYKYCYGSAPMTKALCVWDSGSGINLLATYSEVFPNPRICWFCMEKCSLYHHGKVEPRQLGCYSPVTILEISKKLGLKLPICTLHASHWEHTSLHNAFHRKSNFPFFHFAQICRVMD